MRSKGLLLVLGLAFISLGASSESRLREIVKRGNEAWVIAGRTLKKEPLEPYFAGEALAYLSNILTTSQAEGVYMDLELVKVEYRNIVINPDRVTGLVTVSEYWRVTWRHLGTDKCDVILKPRERRQTYRFQKAGADWRIVGIDEEPNPPPIETQECPS